MTISEAQVGTNWDVLTFGGGGYFYDSMLYSDWALDRNIWNFKGVFVPDQYIKGNLAESWEINDPQTITVHVRKGIKWQNRAPVNGREFTAVDAQAHYKREMTQSPMFAGMLKDWESVTATDNYTLVYKFKKASGQWLQSIWDVVPFIEAPEWAKLSDADRNEWKNTVGTGPWMLTDFVQGSAYTYSKNPNYFGRDERYPENQLPYADKLVSLVILDSSTRVAALRTAKVDYLGIANTFIGWAQAGSIAKSNPEIMQGQIPNASFGVAMRLDTRPFKDVRVRQALNMAIDRTMIAKSHYGGYAMGKPSGLITATYKGYSYAYDDWPQSLKDQYAYNPAGAKQLLKEAGYPTGFTTNVIAANTQDLEVLQIMKAEFKDINVDMTINVMDWPTYENMRRGSKDDQMVAENGAFAWPLARVIEQFYSRGPDAAETMVNDPGYDAIHDKLAAATNPAEAQRLAVELDKYVIEHHWLVTVGEAYTFAVWQPYFKGYSGEYIFRDVPLTLARLWIDQSMKK